MILSMLRHALHKFGFRSNDQHCAIRAVKITIFLIPLLTEYMITR